jgi:ribonucleoside-diphosphate reductase alpha chain
MTRERLANRRPSANFSFHLDGMYFVATVSRFSDGKLAEIFLSNGKIGSGADSAAQKVATAVQGHVIEHLVEDAGAKH